MSTRSFQLLIIALCTLAAWIVPMILINARSNLNYLLTGFVFASVFYCVYLLICGMERLLETISTHHYRYTAGMIIGAAPITILMVTRSIYLESFFVFNRGIALLNPMIICLLTLILLVIHFVWMKKWVGALYNVALYYLLPLAFVYVGFAFIDTSEGEVIFGNVGLMYFFLIGIMIRTRSKHQST